MNSGIALETQQRVRATRERRALSSRLPRTGKVVISNETDPISCAVKNFSREGAVLGMSGWLGLPSVFFLYVEPDQIKAKCRIKSRRGSNVSIEFVELEENCRYSTSL